MTERAPQKTKDAWKKAGIMPRSVDREVVEAMHRIHMGVDSDYTNILLHAMRTALSDGWGGSMMGTDASDILFGTPTPLKAWINLATISRDKVNIVLHGHNPVLSDMIVKAAADPGLVKRAKDARRSGYQPRRDVLYRERTPHAAWHPPCRQFLRPGTGDCDRGN